MMSAESLLARPSADLHRFPNFAPTVRRLRRGSGPSPRRGRPERGCNVLCLFPWFDRLCKSLARGSVMFSGGVMKGEEEPQRSILHAGDPRTLRVVRAAVVSGFRSG